jgi:Caspase domain
MSAQSASPLDSVAAHCFGIFVGISTFEDPKYREHSIPNACDDAGDVRDALMEHWHWPAANILSFCGRVTLSTISDGFSRLLRLLEGDPHPATCLVYFSTHGHLLSTRPQQSKRDLILLASDSNLRDDIKAQDGLTRGRLEGYIGVLPAARKVIILDACYSALVPAIGLASDDIYQPSDAAVLASSRLESRFDPTARNSEFTQILLRDLRKRRAQLTVAALFQSVSKRLRQRKGAPEPILRFEGADILLGIAATARKRGATPGQIIQAFTADAKAAIRPKTGLALDTYIRRPDLEHTFSEFLEQAEQPAFTLIAAAGNGKSTSMRQLALRCMEEGRPVLWFPEPRSEREMDLERFLAGALLPFHETKLSVLNKLEGRLVVFLDGINEWRETSAIPDFFRQVFTLAQKYRFRFIVSCRELAWNTLGTEFTKKNTFAVDALRKDSTSGEVSAYLPVFDDQELKAVLDTYPQAQTLLVNPLIRHPIFVAVVVHILKSRDITSEEITLSRILGAYIGTKADAAANRLGVDTGTVDRQLAAISGDMFQRRRDFIPTDNYFEIAGGALGTALLDEGLFVSGPNGVGTELELILDYLFAQHLPSDPLADFAEFERMAEAFPRIKGAVSLRLCDMAKQTTVKSRLQQLHRAGYISMVLETVRLLPSVAAYKNLLLEIMEVARQQFAEAHYYDWELKRWNDIQYRDFRDKLAEQLNNDDAVLLYDCIEANPQEGLRTLLFDWLVDRSPLEGGSQATIDGVASIYLRAFGQSHPPIALNLLDTAFETDGWAPNPYLVFSVIKAVTQAQPAMATEHAFRWMAWPRYTVASVWVLYELPVSEPKLINELGRRLVEQEDNLPIANDALASLARISNRETLDFVAAGAGNRDLWPGVLRALRELHATFPRETRALADGIADQAGLSAETLKAAIDFYCVAAKNDFPAFETYAEQILPGLQQKEDLLDYLFAKATATFRADDARVREWYERWLSRAPSGWAMEHLARIIRQMRRFGNQDLPWLKKWATHSHAMYYPDWLINSDLSDHEAADLLSVIEEKHAVALDKVGEANGRLRRIAALLVTRPQLAFFPKPDREFWQGMAGKDV